VRLSPLGTSVTNWPILTAPDGRRWMWSSRWNENWQRKPKYYEKTRPSATLSTTDPTWYALGSNQGRRSGKPTTNRLSYGTASWETLRRNTSTSLHVVTAHRREKSEDRLLYYSYYFHAFQNIICIKRPNNEIIPQRKFLEKLATNITTSCCWTQNFVLFSQDYATALSPEAVVGHRYTYSTTLVLWDRLLQS
jgi:hypothetical protein